MSFTINGYTVSWSPWIEGSVKDIQEVLTYFAERIIEKQGDEPAAVIELEKFLRNKPAEFCAFIDPEEKTILFGTEQETLSAMDRAKRAI